MNTEAALSETVERLNASLIRSRNIARGLREMGLAGPKPSTSRYAYLSVDKIYSREHMHKALEHNLREDHAYTADKSVTEPIRVVAGAKSSQRGLVRYDAALQDAYVTKNAKRTVYGSEWCIKDMPTEDFLLLSRQEQERWAQDRIDFLIEELGYPKWALISAAIHLDEKELHLQILMANVYERQSPQGLRQARAHGEDPDSVPREKAVSHSRYVGSRKSDLRKLQDRYFAYINTRWPDLERGLPVEKTGAKRLTGKEWARVMTEATDTLERQMDENEVELAWARDKLVAVHEANAKLRKELEAKTAELTVALQNEQAAIELMWKNAREALASEMADEKAKAKARAKAEAEREMAAERGRIAAEAEALNRRAAMLASSEAQLKADQQALKSATAEAGRAVEAAEAALAEREKAHEASVSRAASIIAYAGSLEKREAVLREQRAFVDQFAPLFRELTAYKHLMTEREVARLTKVAPTVNAAVKRQRQIERDVAAARRVPPPQGLSYAEQKRLAEQRREARNAAFDASRRR